MEYRVQSVMGGHPVSAGTVVGAGHIHLPDLDQTVHRETELQKWLEPD